MTKHSFAYAKEINGHYEIALSAENYAEVDRVYQEVIQKGATPVIEPIIEPWGQKTCYIADPDRGEFD